MSFKSITSERKVYFEPFWRGCAKLSTDESFKRQSQLLSDLAHRARVSMMN